MGGGSRDGRGRRGRHPALDRRPPGRGRQHLRGRLARRRHRRSPTSRAAGRRGRPGGDRSPEAFRDVVADVPRRARRDPAPHRGRRREAHRGARPGRDPRQRLAAALAPPRRHAARRHELPVLRRPPLRCTAIWHRTTGRPAATATTSAGTRPASPRSSRRGTPPSCSPPGASPRPRRRQHGRRQAAGMGAADGVPARGHHGRGRPARRGVQRRPGPRHRGRGPAGRGPPRAPDQLHRQRAHRPADRRRAAANVTP